MVSRLTDLHRASQNRIGRQAAADLAGVFDLLDLEAIDATAERWLTTARGVVMSHASDSASLARQYLQAFRDSEIGDPGFPAQWFPNAAKIDTSLLVTGPIRAKKIAGTGRTLDDIYRITQAVSAASGQRLALDAGREVLVETIRSDERARGWERVTSGNACAFCESLAGRGAAYSEQTSGFQAHDGCGCSAEPVYL